MDWENLPFFTQKIISFVSVNGIKLIAAILIYIVGRWVAKLLSNFIRKLMTKKKVEGTLVIFVGNLVYAILLIIVIIAAIGRLGVQTTSFVAILGAAVLAVGLALQGTLSNFAAGVMLLLFKPFRVGDAVIAGGQTGTVHDLGIFHTTILTGDNKKVIVPNTGITGGAITNFSAMPTRRIELTLSVPGTTDMNKARDILKALLASDERILSDPPPAVVISDATAGEIKFGVFPHVKNADMGAVQADLLEKIKRTFTEAGIWS